MKLWKKLLVSTTAAALLLAQGVIFGAAEPETREWLDPFNDASFPLAKSVNIEYPPNYDAQPAKDKIFSLNGDKKALAAIKTGATDELFKRVLGKGFSEVRQSTLLKDYVGVQLELIYEFENGFQEFEFMGACGEPGIWAGMYGMENTIEFAYADKEEGPYHTYDYLSIREIASADSTRAYFRSSLAGDIPTSARYLRITFLHGYDESSDPAGNTMNYPAYLNWKCALGYLYVREYVTPPASGSGTTTANRPADTTANRPVNTTAKADTTTTAKAPDVSAAPPAGTEDTTLAAETAVTGDSSTQATVSQEPEATAGDVSGGTTAPAQQTITITRINWPVVIALIVVGVLVVGGGVTFGIIWMKKKRKTP